MENILGIKTDKGKTELSVKKKQEIEYLFEGTIKPKRGQKVFEINEDTGSVEPAQYKSDTIKFNSSDRQIEKLIKRSGCIYIPALNSENAKRKYLSNKDQRFYYSKEPVMRLENFN